jgi:hypothetical protein
MKWYYFLSLILVCFTPVWAQTNPPLDYVVSDIEKIDALIDVPLLGTLAGLSLASASLLISGRGQLEEQVNNGNARLANEPDSETRKTIKENMRKLNVERKYVDGGIQYMLKAFFLFVASMISLLLFFDSFYDKAYVTEVQNEIIVIIFEVIPFLTGLILLVIGAEHIRRAYTKKTK